MTNLTAPVINRSGSNATIMTEIEIDCLKSQAYRFEWTIFEAENNQRKIINLDIPTDGTSITIPPYSLPFGLICVQLNVSMTHPLFAHIHTVEEVFFNVNVTNVTVKIVNGEDGLERYYREVRSPCFDIWPMLALNPVRTGAGCSPSLFHSRSITPKQQKIFS